MKIKEKGKKLTQRKTNHEIKKRYQLNCHFYKKKSYKKVKLRKMKKVKNIL